jgi:hypothetical protein
MDEFVPLVIFTDENNHVKSVEEYR